MKKWRILGLWLFVGWALHAVPIEGRIAVLAGTGDRAQAQQIVETAGKLLREEGVPAGTSWKLSLHRVRDLWLVELGPLPADEKENARLMLALRRHYPSLLLLSKPTPSKSRQSTVEAAGPIQHETPTLRMEWFALLLVGGIGILWLGLRTRGLRKMENEQRSMEDLQRSMQARLHSMKGE